MLKHLYLILISTFIFGFITGVILYLQNNTGKEGDGALEANTRGITILAYQYGGCTSLGCPSYRIANNGSYTYIIRDREAGEKRFEDVLSDSQQERIKDSLASIDLDAVYDTEFVGTCPIAYDGIAHRYDITYKGERYEFDSCTELLEGKELFDTLEDYFEIFRITHADF